jgi:hypothetical protein
MSYHPENDREAVAYCQRLDARMARRLWIGNGVMFGLLALLFVTSSIA